MRKAATPTSRGSKNTVLSALDLHCALQFFLWSRWFRTWNVGGADCLPRTYTQAPLNFVLQVTNAQGLGTGLGSSPEHSLIAVEKFATQTLRRPENNIIAYLESLFLSIRQKRICYPHALAITWIIGFWSSCWSVDVCINILVALLYTLHSDTNKKKEKIQWNASSVCTALESIHFMLCQYLHFFTLLLHWCFCTDTSTGSPSNFFPNPMNCFNSALTYSFPSPRLTRPALEEKLLEKPNPLARLSTPLTSTIIICMQLESKHYTLSASLPPASLENIVWSWLDSYSWKVPTLWSH